jgi:hypothetical protein
MVNSSRAHAVILGTLSLFAAAAAWAIDPSVLAQVHAIDASTPKDVQIALALSAGPPVANAATVYIIGPKGYEKAREGSNGFTCLVEHGAQNPIVPVCYDVEGTATLVPVDLYLESERAQGRADKDIAKAINDGYKSGLYVAPRAGGVAYMLSPYNYLFDKHLKQVKNVPAHVMFYAPYATADKLGDGFGVPDLTDPGQPDNCFAIVPDANGFHH